MPPERTLPDYDRQLSGFHAAFEPELLAVIKALPLTSGMAVLDFACGDGFYARRIAEQLGPEGSVTGVDINLAYLKEAKAEAEKQRRGAKIAFIAAAFDQLPFAAESFDFIWCAQSFFSLPDPGTALQQMHRLLRPRGFVAILENDSLHQISLPWPVHLELLMRQAELRAFSEENANPSKFYVGRRLPAVLAAAGFEPLALTTQAIDRRAPLKAAERTLLLSYLHGIAKHIAPYLSTPLNDELKELGNLQSPRCLLHDPYLTMTWLNVLALGRKSPVKS